LGLSTVKVSELTISPKTAVRDLLLAVLLELGRPVTIVEAANFLEHHGFGDSGQLMASLQKARPGAAPFVRDGEFYALDTNDRDLWYMGRRLGLKIPFDRDLIKRDSNLQIGMSFPAQGEGRCIAYVFPEIEPKILCLINESSRDIRSYHLPESLAAGIEAIKQFSTVVGLNPKHILASLGFAWEGFSLVDLSQHAKSKTINKSGRKIKITTDLLITSSCGISRPFGDSEKMHEYIKNGQTSKLKARAEANAKSLFWFHHYARLHGHAFLRWGFLQEDVETRFVSWSNRSLRSVIYSAIEQKLALEVVRGSAPGWENPWARAIKVLPVRDREYFFDLITESGESVPIEQIQLARVVDR
jgi:hypothetical protein